MLIPDSIVSKLLRCPRQTKVVFTPQVNPSINLQMYKNTKDYVFGLPGVNCACQLGQQGVRKAVECACAVSEYSTLKLNGLKDSLAVQEADQNNPGKFKLVLKRN